MKTPNQLFLFSVMSALSAAALADGADSPRPDTSQWKCESCKFEQGTSGSVDVGAGYVSNRSAKFGEYNGLNKDGGFPVGDGAVSYRGKDGNYWNLNASNLGLNTRSIGAEGGQQGQYKLRLNYDELQHIISDTAVTPYIGSGGTTLTLPAGFPAATTAAMPLGSAQAVDIGMRRKRVGVGAAWTAVENWEYALNFRNETKDGTKRSAGAFFLNSAQLLEPVNYSTDQVDASATYSSGKLQAKFAYYGSTFRDRNSSLTFQDPYTTLTGERFGQLTLPPDNQFHQVSASAGYQFTDKTRGSADIAYGRMSQNASFLAPTLNTVAIGLLQPLPSASLDGRANTLDANLKLSSAVTDRLRLNGAYTRNERNNQTPQALYPVVSTDMFGPTPRMNLPYSFTQDKLKLSGDYKATERVRASAGFDYDTHKRTFQEVDRTREDTVWGKVSSHIVDTVDLSFKYAHSVRRNNGYQVVPGITPPENPLLRKYSLADRTRQTTGLRIDIAASENVSAGLGFDLSNDDYTNSTIGLLNGREFAVNGDVSVIISPETSMRFYGGHQEIRSLQAGSQVFAAADWTGENIDTVDFLGVGVKHAVIKDKFDIGADFNLTRSRSQINVFTGAPNSAFPDMTAALSSFKLYADYKVNEKMSLIGSYWYEHYNSGNWMLDGVAPSAIPNVVTFGEQAPYYKVQVIRMAVRYKF